MEHFILTAQPIISDAFGVGCCIQASRVTLTVLNAFGISAQCVPVKLMVGLPHRDLSFNLGSSPEELVASGMKFYPQTFDERGWMGHLVVVPDDRMMGQRWILDPSFGQAIHGLNNAGAGIDWEPIVQSIPLGPTFDRKVPRRYSFTLPGGVTLLTIYTATRDTSYRREKCWGDKNNQAVAETIFQAVKKSVGL